MDVFEISATILGIPFLISVATWIVASLSNPTSGQVIEKGGELIAQAAIPWWIPVLQFLSGIPLVGAILAVIFLIILVSR